MIKALIAPITLLASLAACAPTATVTESANAQTATARGGGLVSAADPRASAAGQAILRQGGSAADAAMAMMLALTVAEPQSSGIGGGGFLLYHDAASGELVTVNGRETAPSSADEALFLDENGEPLGFLRAFQGGHSVGIPGNIRLMAEVHSRWGSLEWAALFEPAIALAEDGYEVTPRMANFLERLAPLWENFPEARAIYWQDGRPKQVGERVTNPALAALLRQVAEEGADAFYTGENAQAIVNAVSETAVNPATITLDDIAAYEPAIQDAVCMPYREYRVCGMGPPSSGATTVLQILGTLSPYAMGDLGADDPVAWHLIGEAMQLAYADRELYLGDPAFVNVPVEGMLSPEYLATRSAMIAPNAVRADYPAGSPPGAEPRTAAISSEVAGTTHFVAVDGEGNLVSMTSTIEGPFGSQLIANGYFLNNELTDFTFAPMRDGAPVANRVQPGKRPLSSMSPTVVYDADGEPVLILGSAGGKRIIMHVAKTLIAFIDFGLPIDEAIAAPNIYFGREGLLVEEDTYLAEMLPALRALGHREIAATGLTSKVNAAERRDGRWVGAADPRSEGVALAE